MHWRCFRVGGRVVLTAAGMALAPAPAAAHGPLFSPAPETIWKGGTEVTLGYHFARASGGGKEQEHEPFVELEYGITPDFEVGAEVPYVLKQENGRDSDGVGDVRLGAKYQFWKRDLPHAQPKAAAFLQIELPSGDDDSEPRIGSGSTDVIGGLAWGYEGRRWYAFASGLYRANTEGEGGLEKGDRQSLNLVGGVRPWLTGYYEPDTVLMLELNWEHAAHDERDGAELRDTGGWELFVSPVAWWTYRQYAVRAGVQVPLAEDLEGDQPDTDVRALVEFVYHW